MTSRPTPIAIVGLSCRLPGGASTPDKLWDLLVEGKNTWTKAPSSRYNDEAFLHPNADFQGGHNHEGGHFLTDNIASFDADFFGISPQEAEAMDPQQRLLLETTYEAFESAGITTDRFRGSNTSVYVANFTNDYDRNIFKDPLNIPKYHVTGCGEAILANRLSYAFDLKGPSMTINTGCSGGLVSLHQACQSLQLGESEMAVAAGANLILSPDHMISMSNLHMLNSHGHSYSFEARGAGYGRGEGVVSIVLKKLDQALHDGDKVRAIIRCTGINQDGKTNGITRPNAKAQQALIENVHQRAMIPTTDLAYLEAHGTGTKAGDSLESDAIANAICSKRDKPLWVGSIKSNIGHLEACSGLAAIVKAVCILDKRQIPPNSDFQAPKRELDLERKKIKIPQRVESLGEAEVSNLQCQDFKPLLAGVSAFGYGGTNAYALLESASALDLGYGGQDRLEKRTDPERKSQLFLLSAHSECSANAVATKLAQWLSSYADEQMLRSVAYTLSNRRSIMPWRLAYVAENTEELLQALKLRQSPPSLASAPQTVFVFSGQGAQWAGMGVELLDNPCFSESFSASQAALHELGVTWNLFDELKRPPDQSRINDSELAQPINTALQLGLLDMLSELGVYPQAVIGHSSGEIAAAYAAGILSKANALKIAYYRGTVSGIVKTLHDGSMIAVEISENEIDSLLKNNQCTEISVACVNGPNSTTLSGSKEAILQFKDRLDEHSIPNRVLNVDVAYHSQHMREVAQQYQMYLGSIDYCPSTAMFFSTVSGACKVSQFDASYWTENLTSKVSFYGALKECVSNLSRDLQELQKSSISFLEIGPHRVLANLIKQAMSGLSSPPAYAYNSTLSKGSESLRSFQSLVGHLFEQGLELNPQSLDDLHANNNCPKQLLDLPQYPWDHSKDFWYEPRLSLIYRTRTRPYNDLLGLKLEHSTSIEPRWRYILGLDTHPWLADHVVSGLPVYPGAGYLCMAIEAAQDMIEDDNLEKRALNITLKNVTFAEALFIPQLPHRIEMQLSFHLCQKANPKNGSVVYSFCIASLAEEDKWIEHCRGFVEVTPQLAHMKQSDLFTRTSHQRDTALVDVSPHTVYKKLDKQGNSYGEHFALISRFSMSESCATATVQVRRETSTIPAKYQRKQLMHPTTLDSLLHSSLPLYSQIDKSRALMPTRIEHFTLSRSLASTASAPLLVEARKVSVQDSRSQFDLAAYRGEEGNTPMLLIQGLRLQAISADSDGCVASHRDICYQLRWDLDSDSLDTSSFSAGTENTKQIHSVQLRTNILNKAAFYYLSLCLTQLTELSATAADPQIGKLLQQLKSCKYSDAVQQLELGSNGWTAPEIKDCKFQTRPEWQLLVRVGSSFLSVVTGKAKIRQHLPQDPLVRRFFEESDSLRRVNAKFTEYIQHLFFKHPDMTVLEIGGNSGTVTTSFFHALKRNSTIPIKYDFTDTANVSFKDAEHNLDAWSQFIRFRRLDISKNPQSQGFEEHSYDLIIIANYFPMNDDVRLVLGNVQKLLKPTGKLAMIEITKAQPYMDLIFSLSFEKCTVARRKYPNAPFMAPEQWRSLLTEQSYAPQFTVNDTSIDGTQASLMVSSLSNEVKSETLRVRILEIKDSSKASSVLAEELSVELEQKNHAVSSQGWDSELQTDANIYIVIDGRKNSPLNANDTDSFQRTLALLRNGRRLLWLSLQDSESLEQNASKSLINGLARIAHAENSHLQLIIMDIQEDPRKNRRRLIQTITRVFESSFVTTALPKMQLEREYVYRDGNLSIPRLIPDARMNDWVSGKEHTQIIREAYKNSFWAVSPQQHLAKKPKELLFERANPVHCDTKKHEIEIKVEAWGIHAADAKSLKDGDTANRLRECVGTISDCGSLSNLQHGQHVVTLCKSPFASRVRVDASTVCLLRTDETMTTAASTAFTSVIAYHVLKRMIGLTENESVLVHGAPNHQILAIIAMALHVKTKVFAIVPENSHRCLLLEKFPLSREAVLLEQSESGIEAVFSHTHGCGVDALISFSDPDECRSIFSCISPLGKCVLLGPATQLPLPDVLTSSTITHMSFDPDVFRELQPSVIAPMLSATREMSSQGMPRSDYLTETMSVSDLGDVVRKASTSEFQGKLIATAGDSDLVNVSKPQISQMSLSKDATYLVCGGLGDVGQSVCQFLARRGAKHIVIFSRRSSGSPAEKDLLSKVRSISRDATIHVYRCDIADAAQLEKVVMEISKLGLPPVRGIVQATVVLRDQLLENLTLEDFKVPLAPKVDGTVHLQKTFASGGLDFFLVFPSVASIVGSGGQAGYGAANAFQDQFAVRHADDKTRYLALDLGMVGDSKAITTQRQQVLEKQGLVLIEPDEVLRFLEYALSPEAATIVPHQLVIGLDSHSIATARKYTSNGNVHAPMFNHVLPNPVDEALTKQQQHPQTFKDRIASLRSSEEIESIVKYTLASHLSTIVAASSYQINSTTKLSDLGMDSLTALEIRNWIMKEFQAMLRTSEMIDEADIQSLAHKIITRSKLVAALPNEETKPGTDLSGEMALSRKSSIEDADEEAQDLPRLPLPDLASSLDQYLSSRRIFMSRDEQNETSKLVEQFLHEGTGTKLQKRLESLHSDPKIKNWLSDIYADCVYLNRRDPIYPYGIFMGIHPLTETPHSQTERAAVIAKAAIDLQRQIEDGSLPPDSLNGERLCMESSNWLFNACREPQFGTDRMRKYANESYFAVLRRGHLFSVCYSDDRDTLKDLEKTFESILDQSNSRVPSLATLTSSQRDDWAKIRRSLTLESSDDQAAIEMIEKASFVICLDDGIPSTPSERCNQLFLGNPANRWADKTVQYVVFENGISGFIGEHARIDGMGARPMVRQITDAIARHRPSSKGSQNATIDLPSGRPASGSAPSTQPLVQEYLTNPTPSLISTISKISIDFHSTFTPIEFRHLSIPTLGSSFLRAHRCAPKTGYQLVIQLACRLWYGHFPDIWETVSTARFLKGRIDWLQTVSEDSAAFVDEALPLLENLGSEGLKDESDEEAQGEEYDGLDWDKLRDLFHAAASTHAKAVTRIASGHGFKAHMHALRAMVREKKPRLSRTEAAHHEEETPQPTIKGKEKATVAPPQEIETGLTDPDVEFEPHQLLEPNGVATQLHDDIENVEEGENEEEAEETPPLFLSPQWRATEVSSIKKVKVDCLDGMPMQETAFLMPQSNCIFLHYEVSDDGCKFFVQTWPGLADGLCEKLVLAAEVVRRVLEGG